MSNNSIPESIPGSINGSIPGSIPESAEYISDDNYDRFKITNDFDLSKSMEAIDLNL